MKTQIFKTEKDAISQAKSDFAQLFNISRKSITIKHDDFNERRYGSTICVCGETKCIYLVPKNLSKKQEQLLSEKNIYSYAYGICYSCGDKF